MSGDFITPAELFAWVYALTRVEPGDFAAFSLPATPCDQLPGPMATCCNARRVSLTADRSDFTREAFGSFV